MNINVKTKNDLDERAITEVLFKTKKAQHENPRATLEN